MNAANSFLSINYTPFSRDFTQSIDNTLILAQLLNPLWCGSSVPQRCATDTIELAPTTKALLLLKSVFFLRLSPQFALEK